jgi:hypothetical protein
MTVECITCARFAFRGCDLAAHGFGLCALRPSYESHSATRPHECGDHQPAKPELVAQRREWADRQAARVAARVKDGA